MIRQLNGFHYFDSNADLHEWFVVNPKVTGFAEIFLCVSLSPANSKTRKTARTLKDANGKAQLFENFFPKGVYHAYQMSICVGCDYGTMVNNRIEKVGTIEGVTFEPSPLPWGTWDIFGRIIMHHGGWYLRIYPRQDGFKQLSETYVNCDGDIIDPVMWDLFVQEFKEIKKESAKQADAGLAKEDQVLCQSPKFDSIHELHIGGIKLKRIGLNLFNR